MHAEKEWKSKEKKEQTLEEHTFISLQSFTILKLHFKINITKFQ